MGYERITPSERTKIKDMTVAGMSAPEIAKRLGRSTGAIYNVRKTYRLGNVVKAITNGHAKTESPGLAVKINERFAKLETELADVKALATRLLAIWE